MVTLYDDYNDHMKQYDNYDDADNNNEYELLITNELDRRNANNDFTSW